MLNPELLINTTIDHKYHLHQFLGNGTLGWVYRAEELASGEFAGSCAVKLLRPKDPDDRSVVLRELMALARLCHPRLVGLRGSGHISEGPAAGNLYLALELADTTLQRELQERGKLPADEVAGLVGDLAEGLAYLHQQGYVHRDVKPSNIFRVKGTWKLGDFGMVRLKESSGNLSPVLLTALGYLAPEGVEGFVGASLDVWALGVVAQEALTQRLPYNGHSFEDMVTDVLYKEPHVEDNLPAPFDVIVARTLVRDRTRRWSARDVADALRRATPIDTVAVHRGEGHRGVLTAVRWADPLTLMTASADRTILVWNADSVEVRQPLAAPTALLSLAAGHGNVYAGGADGRIYRWEWPSGRPIDAIEVGQGIVAALALSPDGERLASSTNRGEIDLWETASTSSISIVGQAHSAIFGVAFGPDGTWLVAGGEDNQLHFFDGVNGTWLGSLAGHTAPIRSVAVSSDGLMLASGGDDGTVRVWDIATGKEKYIWDMHSHRVSAVAFRPGDAELASGGEDRTARRWDLKTGQPLATLEHDAAVTGLSYSPTGTSLATAALDRLLRIYPV